MSVCFCDNSTACSYILSYFTIFIIFINKFYAHFTDECFAQTIKPLQDITQVTEGKPVNLSCKYDGSVQSLLWYRQYPGSGLEYLLLVLESSKKTVAYADPPIPRLDGEMSMKDKRVDLIISSAEVTDSALYYCALVPTVTENTTPLYKNLQPYSTRNTQMVLK